MCLVCCSNRPNSNKVTQSQDTTVKSSLNSSYDFQNPSKTFVLDHKLDEISSLAYDTNSNSFLTSDDESGHFFELSYLDLSILKETKFGIKGDYEAIEIIDNEVWIVKSNGTLNRYNRNSKETSILRTILRTENDVEGSCVLANQKLLLLACKGKPLHNDNTKKKTKCIYVYDLNAQYLATEPYIKLTDQSLLALIENSTHMYSKSQLKKLKLKAQKFAPSGIAIHPITEDIYITSAKGSTVIILDKYKNLRTIEFLPSRIIPQPEGITFDAVGNLFIATEGHGLSAKVFRFDYNQ